MIKISTKNSKGGHTLETPRRRAKTVIVQIEDNLKKALTELLILFLFGEEEHYIGELPPLLEKRSHGVLSIVFPYAAIYRITQSGYLTETKRKPPRMDGCGSIMPLRRPAAPTSRNC